jgi:hypothetical protein
MRRTLTLAAALLLAALAPGGAGAQEMMDRDGMMSPRISRFDLGVYAGGSLTSRWYESRTVTLNGTTTPQDNEDSQEYAPGYAPVFGAQATAWALPWLGLRLNGMYAPMRVPFASEGFFDLGDEIGDSQQYPLNSYFYDLSLALRPFARSERFYRTVYLFAGGGGLTVDLAGEDRSACEAGTLSRGACLSYEPDHATVGQGTAGAGITLLPLGSSLGIFGELAAHIYDSPVHVGDGWTPRIVAPRGSTVRLADDRTAVTARAVIGLKAMFGNFVPPVVAMVPPPPPPPVAPPPAEQPPVVDMRDIQVCVLQNGQLANVTATYNPTRGDTTVNGQAFSSAFPTTGEYAANATWYINNTPITFQNRRFVKYGLPRVLGVNEVTRVGEFMGTPVFAEVGQSRPDVVYVLVRPGCEFQPYQVESKTGSVRGE